MSRRLIVNADDFGMSAGVNVGILEAHHTGLITSTSVMANMPHAEAGVRAALSKAPDLGLGLHLNLVWGPPVLPAAEVASLVSPEGLFWGFPRIMAVSLDDAQMRAEIEAQFDRFVEIAGQAPDHIDAHMFTANLIPAAWAATVDLATQHRLPIRDPSTWLDLDRACDVAERIGGFKVGEPLLSFLRQSIPLNRQIAAQAQGLRWPDHFEYRFYGQHSTRATLEDILRHLPQGTTELMCHPGYILDPDDGYGVTRETELRLLTDPAMHALVEAEGIELVSFAQV
ncbi:MAG: ChbG/HpnK family deacetylase [Anaerolineae bacterium]|nr:ChbG/HpnK family deacetylase [Anaerolineae bacterium]